ncbi:hypothetical protein FFWV33_13185 [Flavobacterium faecale]|uniref:DUF5020 domain-containing protein n=1 Tax=Flavobacterium faecale TaxID=1355330 RepID=A0A2S1LFD0_9FLAO|nr:DUF5020 family protein [Flavobacterium faecale]AWG22409.1 hypothetical protein FFWV33_13185 [Flavobacterium faecale]
MKTSLAFLICFFTLGTTAQEIQLHYDFSKTRNYLTGTFEVFKPDSAGSTFFFTDFNFGRQDGANLAYFEIARKFDIKNETIKGLNLHIEYNDGFVMTDDKSSSPVSPIGFPINRAYLAGFGFPIKIGNFTLHTSYLYKNTKGSSGIDGQFTAVFFQNLFKNKVTIRGFFDFWSQEIVLSSPDSNKKHMILLTEPQIMYNFTPKFSVGSEIEISNNFVPNKAFKVYPTLFAKYTL